MPLVRRGLEALALEHMPEMPTTVGTHNLSARHPKGSILMSRDGSRDAVKVGRPAAPGAELVAGLVQRCLAAGAAVDAFRGVVLVEFARARRLSAFLAEDAELFWLCELSAL